MPQLAAFPKAFMDDLCVTGKMTLKQWIDLSASLEIEGLELYAGILDLSNLSLWPETRNLIERHGMVMPMLCCSPDFTHPEKSFREEQIALQRGWIEMTAAFGGSYCRVLSGQRRPEISSEQGIKLTVSSIEACLPHAEKFGVTLTLENHYKDNYWIYPEFAQRMEIFCEIVNLIDSPYFGVNYDPSNTLLAGEDPLELLRKVKDRVVTMHASDRYLTSGTLEDLRREENIQGYVKRLEHGEIGKGLNDYDAIFQELSNVGFDGWISIEDGVEGMEQLKRSVAFLKRKISQHWQPQSP